MRTLGMVFAAVLGLAVLLSALFGARWIGLQYDGIFLQREADVRTDAHRHSKAFVEGQVSQIRQRKVEYLRETNPAVKNALKEEILDYANKLSDEQLASYNVLDFIQGLRNGAPGGNDSMEKQFGDF